MEKATLENFSPGRPAYENSLRLAPVVTTSHSPLRLYDSRLTLLVDVVKFIYPHHIRTRCFKKSELQNTQLWQSTYKNIESFCRQQLNRLPAQYWTSSHVAGTLSLDTSLGSPKTLQLTKHSGVTSTYLSDTFLIKAGGVVRAAQATAGSTRSTGTTTTYHQLICGGDPSCEVIRGWRYGPCRLRVNDDDECRFTWKLAIKKCVCVCVCSIYDDLFMTYNFCLTG